MLITPFRGLGMRQTLLSAEDFVDLCQPVAHGRRGETRAVPSVPVFPSTGKCVDHLARRSSGTLLALSRRAAGLPLVAFLGTETGSAEARCETQRKEIRNA